MYTTSSFTHLACRTGVIFVRFSGEREDDRESARIAWSAIHAQPPVAQLKENTSVNRLYSGKRYLARYRQVKRHLLNMFACCRQDSFNYIPI